LLKPVEGCACVSLQIKAHAQGAAGMRESIKSRSVYIRLLWYEHFLWDRAKSSKVPTSMPLQLKDCKVLEQG
jgi:hypothetical protein